MRNILKSSAVSSTKRKAVKNTGGNCATPIFEVMRFNPQIKLMRMRKARSRAASEVGSPTCEVVAEMREPISESLVSHVGVLMDRRETMAARIEAGLRTKRDRFSKATQAPTRVSY